MNRNVSVRHVPKILRMGVRGLSNHGNRLVNSYILANIYGLIMHDLKGQTGPFADTFYGHGQVYKDICRGVTMLSVGIIDTVLSNCLKTIACIGIHGQLSHL